MHSPRSFASAGSIRKMLHDESTLRKESLMNMRLTKLMALLVSLALVTAIATPTAMAAPSQQQEPQRTLNVWGDAGYDSSDVCWTTWGPCFDRGWYVAVGLSTGEQEGILYGTGASAGALVAVGCSYLSKGVQWICGAFGTEMGRRANDWIQNNGTCSGGRDLVVQMAVGVGGGLAIWCQ